MMNEANPLPAEVLQLLRELEPVFAAHEIDFYLVGAVARDLHLSGAARSMRATKDVDLAICLTSEKQFHAVRNDLLATGAFIETRDPIKLIYRQRIEVDLMPFGAIESAQRTTRLENPRSFIINVPGFRELLPEIIHFQIEGQSLPVCPLEGVVLLKLIAQDDRPERTKDSSDIEHIQRVYFDIFFDDIALQHYSVMELYDTNIPHYPELVSAHVIGRHLARTLHDSPELRARVAHILVKREGDRWQAMHSGLEEQR